MSDGDFLNWVADRLVQVHGEKPGTDFVLKLRDLAGKGQQGGYLMISAGSVPPGPALFTVVLAEGHKTLKQGDLVNMAEYGTENVFVRPADSTVHEIRTEQGYVILTPKEPV